MTYQEALALRIDIESLMNEMEAVETTEERKRIRATIAYLQDKLLIAGF